MSLLQEALTISLTGIAAVFLSLTLLVFVLFVLCKPDTERRPQFGEGSLL